MTEPRDSAAPSRGRRIGSALVAYVVLPLVLLGAMEAAARALAPDAVRRREVTGRLLTPTPGAALPYANTPHYRGTVWGGRVELDGLGHRSVGHQHGGDQNGGGRSGGGGEQSGSEGGVGDRSGGGGAACDTTRRVLLLGDSVGFGVGLDQGDTPSALLALPCTDIANASVIGYATGHHRAQLAAWTGPPPDVLVLLYCLNDPLPKDQVMVSGMLGGAPPLAPSRAAVSVWALAHSSLYVWLRDTIGDEATYRRTFRHAFLPLFDGASWAQNAQDLAAVAAWGRARGVPVVLAAAPHRAQLLHAPESRRPQQRLAETARAHGMAYVDLAPALTAGDFLAADGHHLSAGGMRKAMAVLRGTLAAAPRRLRPAASPPSGP